MSSFYVRPTGKSTWRVLETYYEKGTRKSRQVDRVAFEALGINPEWDLEEARSRIKEINRIHTTKRAVSGAAKRVSDIKRVESAFLPAKLVDEFMQRLKDTTSAKNEKKLMFHWAYAEKLIKKLKIEPQFYFDDAVRIYKYFETTNISPSYAEKIIIVLNHWGKFVCRKHRSYFDPVPYPKGVSLQRIKEGYRKSELYRAGGSLPLTPELLAEIRPKLPNQEQANYLHVTMWLGTRPEETDELITNPESYSIEYDKKHNNDVIWIYQSKLTSIDEDDRWKPIVIRFPEQRQALEFIKGGLLETPLNKTIKSLTKKRITKYGGRKGFTDLMLSRGVALDVIAVEMGHRSIERTWATYKDKQATKVG